MTFSETFLVFLVPLVVFLGVKFGFRKSCLCKRNDKYEVCQRVPFLSDKIDIVEQVIAEFKEYKKSIPTCGVILLNEDLDKVLLVKSYWTKYWGFPQGKIEENETPRACAAREAYEEIGFNVKTFLDPRTWFEKVEIILFQI